MVDKLISSSAVVAKVIADNNLQEKDLRIADIRAWIGEAVEKIGAVTQLDHRVAVVSIKGYLAQLPCNLYKLDQVAYSSNGEGWLPMRKTSGAFPAQSSKKCNSNCKPTVTVPDEAIYQITKTLFNLTPKSKWYEYVADDTEVLKILNENPGIRSTLETLINNHTVDVRYDASHVYNQLQYDVKPGYLVCPMCDGQLKVSYYAVHTDNEGMPMIPDMQSYQEAIYWYVTMKLFYPDYMKGKIPPYIYNDMKNSWNFYAKQAYAEAMLPNVDGLESIQNNWNRLVPELNDHDEFFNYLGDEQIIYNQN